MNKVLVSILAAAICFGFFAGCSQSSRKIYPASTAAITTYSVSYVDSESTNDVDQLNDTIATIISALRADGITVVSTNSPVVNITITNNIDIKVTGHSYVVVSSGDFNECPGLYEALCEYLLGPSYDLDRPRHEARGRQLASDCANRHRN